MTRPNLSMFGGRICIQCQNFKYWDSFYANGKNPRCKACTSANKKAIYAADPEKFKERAHRAYLKIKANPLAYEAYQAKHEARNRPKRTEYMREYRRKQRARLRETNGSNSASID